MGYGSGYRPKILTASPSPPTHLESCWRNYPEFWLYHRRRCSKPRTARLTTSLGPNGKSQYESLTREAQAGNGKVPLTVRSKPSWRECKTSLIGWSKLVRSDVMRFVKHFGHSTRLWEFSHPAIGELNVRRWLETYEFFVGIAHHGRCAEEDFDGWQFALEQQLVDALNPRTFADLDEIDSLIAEGESDA